VADELNDIDDFADIVNKVDKLKASGKLKEAVANLNDLGDKIEQS